MRERQVFITLGLILAVLMLGIAYAAITTQEFNVSGSAVATASDANFDVRFTGTVKASGDGTVSGSIGSTGKSATFDVTNLNTRGQKATVTLNVINNSADINATPVIASVTHTNPTWFNVEAEFGESTYCDSSTGQPILLPGETIPVYITVELLETPGTAADEAAAKDRMTIQIDADATAATPVESGSGGAGNVELITFKISSTTYECPAGWTWEDFVGSSYASANIYIGSYYKIWIDESTWLYYWLTEHTTRKPLATDTIISGCEYLMESDSGTEW